MKRLAAYPLIFSAITLILAGTPQRCPAEVPLGHLEDRLVEKGIERPRVQTLLADAKISLNPTVIIQNLLFSSPASSGDIPGVMKIDPRYIRKGREFIKENESLLSSIEKRFGTSPQAVTAILIVESKLGAFTSPYNVFTAYANLAALLDPDFFQQILKTHGEKYPALNDEAMRERARKKGSWALDQLYHLILLAFDLKTDPLSIMGSFSGALGPAQFIPSSFMSFGVDGDNDGKKDPFNMADAAASIGSYLMRAGWKENADVNTKRQAIWYYNHSRVYVNTIMMIYEELSREEARTPD